MSRSPTEPFAARRAAGAASRQATRERLLTAADELFCDCGYPATTVSAIADRAGVSLQTLYLAWGSKAALFRAAADATATASGMPLSAEAWRERIRRRLRADLTAPVSTSAYLTGVARVFTEVAARSIAYWRMQPAAAATDPEVAAGFEEAMRQRRLTMRQVAGELPPDGLKPDLDPAYIAQTLWVLASPETYALVTGTGASSASGYEGWLSSTLIAALCDEPRSPLPDNS